MNHYEAKQEARRARLEARADRLRRESDSRYRAAMGLLEHIPPGQPILVGHHSERRHRAALAKHDAHMRKAIDADKAAKEAASRAASVGSAGISSDDPEAVDKLREKLAAMEKTHAMMKMANRFIRAKNDDGLRGLGLSDGQIERLKQPDACGRIAFPDYAIKNNSANMARVKQRIAVLEAAASRQTTEREVANTGIRIVENVEENRLQMLFPGKPSADIRACLKAFGFRWSPTSGAWQRHLNNGARYAAEQVLRNIQEQPS